MPYSTPTLSRAMSARRKTFVARRRHVVVARPLTAWEALYAQIFGGSK